MIIIYTLEDLKLAILSNRFLSNTIFEYYEYNYFFNNDIKNINILYKYIICRWNQLQ